MLKNLQVLRAFAALFVVFHHYNFLNFKPGAFGVDIFFVISGFIISFVIEKDKESFFLKRLLRIVPMYFLATLFVIVIWFLRSNVFKTTYVDLPAIVKSFLFIPYPGGPILGLGYTLNFEMYFYLIVACFLKITHTPKQALFCTSIFIISVFTVTHVFPGEFFILNFYGSDVVFEFIYGIILFFIYKTLKQKSLSKKGLYYGLCVCILSIIFLIYVGYPEIPIQFRGFLFGLPALIICSVFVFSEGSFKTNTIIYKFLYKLGNASYIMYLIHPFIIFGVLRLIHPLFDSKNIGLIIIEFLISIAIVCLSSTLIYSRVELPMQRFLKNKFLRTKNRINSNIIKEAGINEAATSPKNVGIGEGRVTS
ncbi:MAG: acyltransferase [Ginsengibacter sp.]